MGIAPHDALLLITRIGYTSDQRAIELTDTYCRNDYYDFVVELRVTPAAPPASQPARLVGTEPSGRARKRRRVDNRSAGRTASSVPNGDAMRSIRSRTSRGMREIGACRPSGTLPNDCSQRPVCASDSRTCQLPLRAPGARARSLHRTPRDNPLRDRAPGTAGGAARPRARPAPATRSRSPTARGCRSRAAAPTAPHARTRISTHTRCLGAASPAHAARRAASAPGRYDCRNTSASCASACSVSMPAASRRSIHVERLPRPVSITSGAMFGRCGPLTSSVCAPCDASVRPATGPAMMRVRSSTRTPVSGWAASPRPIGSTGASPIRSISNSGSDAIARACSSDAHSSGVLINAAHSPASASAVSSAAPSHVRIAAATSSRCALQPSTSRMPSGDAGSSRATGSSVCRPSRRSPSPHDATPAEDHRPRAGSVRCGTRRARRAPTRRRIAQHPCEAGGIRPPRPGCRDRRRGQRADSGRSTAASGPAPLRSHGPARRGRRVRAATDAPKQVRGHGGMGGEEDNIESRIGGRREQS